MKPSSNIWNWHYLFSVFSIIMVDIALRGDNAIVIAAAVRSLPQAVRKRALAAGAAGAIVALIVATFFATRLLQVRFVQALGGLVILWIAGGLFRDESHESSANSNAGLWRAMWLILVADVTMSLDNILAIAAIAEGDFRLVLFGLIVSIPLVIFASSLLADLMDRYSIIVYIGGALLGRVAGHMILTDPWVKSTFAPGAYATYGAEAVGAAGVLLVGWWMKSRAS